MGHSGKCLASFNGKSGVFTVQLLLLNLCGAHTHSTGFDLVEDRVERLLVCLQTNGFQYNHYRQPAAWDHVSACEMAV